MTTTLKDSAQLIKLSLTDAMLIRGFDLSVAFTGLLLLAPALAVIALIIRLTSPGPILYKAQRVGRGGRLFKLYKFRTMVVDADQTGPGVTLNNDPRVTPIGRLLRKFKLDELPQLINILLGEMSLVGPRPEDPRYVALYTPEQRQVLNVRPGLTSRASVYYREEEALLSGDNWETIYKNQILPRKLDAEITYLQHRTLWRDIWLILNTLWAISNGGRRVDSLLDIRNRHFLLLDCCWLLILPGLALTLRVEQLTWTVQIWQALALYTLLGLLVKLPVFYLTGFYRRYWRYAGVNDLLHIPVGVGLAAVLLFLLNIVLHGWLSELGLAMYRTVPLIDGLLTGVVTGGTRLAFRGLYHWHRERNVAVGGRRVLVVGAGEAGAMVVREMRANAQLDKEPVVFVDDDPSKVGSRIQGLPVAGTCDDIPTLVKVYQVQQVIIALPSAPYRRIEEIKTMCQRVGINVYTLPGLYELLAGSKAINHTPNVDTTQLLRRKPVDIDQAEVASYLHGKTILITGGGGSIGSEICRQVARFQPGRLVVLGHGENSIFEISMSLRAAFPDLPLQQVIADVRDAPRIERVVQQYQPSVIFHAAAHKHVPLMEANVEDAFTNNVLGTQNVLRAAEKAGVERFILISSDKAVHPTSIMGATKRIAELLVVAAARRSGRTYMAVRFGNVLGSRGSVLTIFQKQIAAGGPVTVTDPQMTRYFMTIPEAVQLVLQTTVLGEGGKVFMLDMGEPVRIVDLATDLIKLCNMEPDKDINIVYTGIRPGEKLFEELFLTGEHYQRTRHPKVFMATHEESLSDEVLNHFLDDLGQAANNLHTPEATKAFQAKLLNVCRQVDGYQADSAQPKAAARKPGSDTPPSLWSTSTA